jgi:hypothetical protein
MKRHLFAWMTSIRRAGMACIWTVHTDSNTVRPSVRPSVQQISSAVRYSTYSYVPVYYCSIVEVEPGGVHAAGVSLGTVCAPLALPTSLTDTAVAQESRLLLVVE